MAVQEKVSADSLWKDLEGHLPVGAVHGYCGARMRRCATSRRSFRAWG